MPDVSSAEASVSVPEQAAIAWQAGSLPPQAMTVEPVARHVLLVGSNGGHLAQLLVLMPWLRDRRRTWVTFAKTDALSQLTGETVVWAHFPTTRNVPNLLRNFVLAWQVLRRDPPDAIVSTGAGVALPFFVIGRLLGITTVYIEVYDRIDSRTLTGRLCRPFSDLFLVQWPEQRSLYRSARLVGPLL